MNKTLAILLVFMFLASCSSPQTAQQQPRQATFTEVQNNIRSRTGASNEFIPAQMGDQMEVGGEAMSGDASRARLDLTPDGTIVRLGPNTFFALTALETGNTPLTRLKLFFGELWIVLAGGNLEVETDYGSASVRGSLMSVAIHDETGMDVTCLEGHCALGNAAGTVDLLGGQASSIRAPGEPPSPPRSLNPDDLRSWGANCPEAGSLLTATQPAPAAVPSPTPTGGASLLPPHYTLVNQCTLTWHWEFSGPAVIRVDVPAGATVTGELNPAGAYTSTNWFDGGEVHSGSSIPAGGQYTSTACATP